jgi:hypothetical protein
VARKGKAMLDIKKSMSQFNRTVRRRRCLIEHAMCMLRPIGHLHDTHAVTGGGDGGFVVVLPGLPLSEVCALRDDCGGSATFAMLYYAPHT